MPRWKIRPEGSNWGDFGADDQLGRMNLLTPERRLAGLREARTGEAFSLSLPLDYPGALFPARQPPRLFAATMTGGEAYNYSWSDSVPGASDVMCDDGVVLYTQFSTQWDSLAHVGAHFDAVGDGIAEQVYYNGYRAGEHLLSPAQGGPYAKALGVEQFGGIGVQGRAVLVNLHAIYGRAKTVVDYDAFMRALELQRVEVRTGDFLCIYTGFADLVLEMNKKPDLARLTGACAALDGTDPRLLQWITDSGVVALCADNLAVEEVTLAMHADCGCAMMPMHQHCLFKLGVHLGELWYFGELAPWLAAAGRSAFLLTAPPLRLPGAVGSPVTPIATV
jgi:kynurenine formamidase